MSSNLRNKKFMIRNVQYSKEEYDMRMKEIRIGRHHDLFLLRKEFLQIVQCGLHRYANLIKTISCTGDNITNAKNVRDSFDVPEGENLKFCVRTVNLKDSYDVTGGVTGELVYETAVAGHEGHRLRFLSNADILRDVEYSDWCKNSSNLFGCVGVKNKEFCILNKQYTKEDYDKLRARIIQHMRDVPYVDSKGNIYNYGEFFPIALSPFAYNESMAYEHIPLIKTEVSARGYMWRNSDPSPYISTISAENLPDDVMTVSDSITKDIIACSSCSHVYRILQSELSFLKKEGIAVPRKCQECRHQTRFVFRNPLKLWKRSCMCNKTGHFHGAEKCKVKFETSYAPERPEIVYCEKCYQQEVY